MRRSATGGRYEGCGSVVASVEKQGEGGPLRISGARFGVESSHTTEYDGGAPDEGGAESADGRRPQNLI